MSISHFYKQHILEVTGSPDAILQLIFIFYKLLFYKPHLLVSEHSVSSRRISGHWLSFFCNNSMPYAYVLCWRCISNTKHIWTNTTTKTLANKHKHTHANNPYHSHTYVISRSRKIHSNDIGVDLTGSANYKNKSHTCTSIPRFIYFYMYYITE